MITRSLEFYHSAIKNAYPDAACIRCPDIPGMVAPIFFADVLKKTMVCRFSLPEIVFKNKIASDLLRDYNIPAPQTCVHAHVGTWFESYEYCADKTLYEHVQNGLPSDKIFDAYVGVFRLQNEISQIPIHCFLPNSFRYHFETLHATLVTKNALSRIYNDFISFMSGQGKMHLLHNDIHAKNILYSPETGRVRLIDLDAVSLCNENFTMLTTLQRYPLSNRRELMSVYQDITGRKLDCKRIMLAKTAMSALHTMKEKSIAMLQYIK